MNQDNQDSSNDTPDQALEDETISTTINLADAVQLYIAVIYSCVSYTNSSKTMSAYLFYTNHISLFIKVINDACKQIKQNKNKKRIDIHVPIYAFKEKEDSLKVTTFKENEDDMKVLLFNVILEVKSDSIHAMTLSDIDNNLIFNITHKGKKQMITLVREDEELFSFDSKLTSKGKEYKIRKFKKNRFIEFLPILSPIFAVDPHLLNAIYDSN